MRSRHYADVCSGLALTGIGAFFAWFALDYRFGTLARIGPAFMPMMSGFILMGIGLAISLVGMLREGAAVPRPGWRPLVAVSLAILAFTLTIRPLGLVPATLILVVIAALAERVVRPIESIVLAVCLAVLAYLVFLLVLGLPIAPLSRSAARFLGLV